MDREQALAFIADNHRAVLATTRDDGAVQLSPVLAAVGAGAAVVVSTRTTAVKVRNLRRRRRAALAVMSDAFFGTWVQVEGPVEIVPLPEAMDGLVAYYRAISGEHADWDDYRASMEREQRVLLRLTVDRAGPTVSG